MGAASIRKSETAGFTAFRAAHCLSASIFGKEEARVRSKPVACFHPVYPQRLCTRPDPPSGIPGATMWENLTPADLDRVKHELARERAATLIRHAAEVQQLDARYNEVETLNQLINAFAEKNGETNMLPESRDEASPALHVEQQISPTPLRRLGGR
jgi:hypothetical protein